MNTKEEHRHLQRTWDTAVEQWEKQDSPLEYDDYLQGVFVLDVKTCMKKEQRKLVIFLDLCANASSSDISNDEEQRILDWLMGTKTGEHGLMELLPNTVWVIFSREKIRLNREATDSISSYRIGHLSRNESEWALKNALVYGKTLRYEISDFAHCIPAYLALCAKFYEDYCTQHGANPAIEDFGNDCHALFHKVCQSLPSQKCHLIQCLATIGEWTDSMAKSIIPNCTQTLYHEVMEGFPVFVSAERKGTESWQFDADIVGDIQKLVNISQSDRDVMLKKANSYFNRLLQGALKHSNDDSQFLLWSNCVIRLIVQTDELQCQYETMKELLSAADSSTQDKVISKFLEKASSIANEKSLVVAYFQYELGLIKELQQEYSEAYRLLKLSYHTYFDLSDNSNRKFWDVANSFSRIASIVGHTAESLHILEHLASMQKEKIGEYRDEYVKTLEKLTYEYRDWDRDDDSLRKHEEILYILESSHPFEGKGNKDDEAILSAMDDIATDLIILNRQDEARNIIKEMLKRRQEIMVFQQDNISATDEERLQQLCHNADAIWSNQVFLDDDPNVWEENHQKALAVKRDVVDYFLREIGIENDTTLEVLDDLATTLMCASKPDTWQEMVKVRERIVNACRDNMGDEDERTLTALKKLEETLLDWADREYEANKIRSDLIDIYKRRYDDSKKLYGEKDERTIECLYEITDLYSWQGEYNKAVEVNRKIINLQQELLGETHEKSIDAKKVLSFNLHLIGEYEEELEIDKEILASLCKSYEEWEEPCLELMNDIAYDYELIGKWEESINVKRKVLDISRRYLNSDAIINALKELAYTLREQGRHKEELIYRLEILNRCKRKLPNSDHAIEARIMAADTFLALGYQDDALVLKKELEKIKDNNEGQFPFISPDIMDKFREMEVKLS